MARASYSLNSYTGAATAATLTSGIGAADTTLLVSGTSSNWGSLGSTGGWFAAINYGQPGEEKIYVPSGLYPWASGTVTISGVTRGVDNTTAVSQASGVSFVGPVLTAIDLQESNLLVNQTLGAVSTTSGQVLLSTGSGLIFGTVSTSASGYLPTTGGTVGPLTVSGGLTVSGTTTLSGATTVLGTTLLSGGLTAQGTTTFSGGATVFGTTLLSGNTSISGTLNLSGNTITGGVTTSGYVLTATSTTTASFQPATNLGLSTNTLLTANYVISGSLINGTLYTLSAAAGGFTVALSGATSSTPGTTLGFLAVSGTSPITLSGAGNTRINGVAGVPGSITLTSGQYVELHYVVAGGGQSSWWTTAYTPIVPVSGTALSLPNNSLIISSGLTVNTALSTTTNSGASFFTSNANVWAVSASGSGVLVNTSAVNGAQQTLTLRDIATGNSSASFRAIQGSAGGGWQTVNSGFSSPTFTVSDAGNVTIPGTATFGTPPNVTGKWSNMTVSTSGLTTGLATPIANVGLTVSGYTNYLINFDVQVLNGDAATGRNIVAYIYQGASSLATKTAYAVANQVVSIHTSYLVTGLTAGTAYTFYGETTQGGSATGTVQGVGLIILGLN